MLLLRFLLLLLFGFIMQFQRQQQQEQEQEQEQEGTAPYRPLIFKFYMAMNCRLSGSSPSHTRLFLGPPPGDCCIWQYAGITVRCYDRPCVN